MNFVLGLCLNVRLFAELNVAFKKQLDVVIWVRSARKDWKVTGTDMSIPWVLILQISAIKRS